MLGLELPELLEPPTAAHGRRHVIAHHKLTLLPSLHTHTSSQLVQPGGTLSWGTEDVPEAVWEKMAAVVEASGRDR